MFTSLNIENKALATIHYTINYYIIVINKMIVLANYRNTKCDGHL